MINWHERPRACGTNVNEDAFRFSYCRHVRHCGRAYGEHLSGCTRTKGQNGRAVVCISARLYQGQQPGRRSALAPVESRLDEALCVTLAPTHSGSLVKLHQQFSVRRAG
jgi:hypothetical protein